LGEAAKTALLAHDWPGNLRELRHAVQRGALLAAGQAEILPEDLGLSVGRSTQTIEGSLAEAVVQLERRLIQETLERTGGNRSLAARELGLSRQGLLNKLARYRLEKYAQP
jgi:DNA-binding NtrC family response regulator